MKPAIFLGILFLASFVCAENPLKIPEDFSNFIAELEKHWDKRQGDFVVEKETLKNMPVITASKPGYLSFVSKEKIRVPVEMRCFVRLRTFASKSAHASFHIGKKDISDPGLTLTLSLTDNPQYPERVNCSVRNSGKLLHDNNELAKNMDWVPVFSNGFTYILKAYPKILPGWPVDYRRQIENDMSQLPDHNSKWIEIRILLRENSVWFWVDDRLVAYKKDADFQKEGFAGLTLSQGVQISGLSISKAFEEIPDFYPAR